MFFIVCAALVAFKHRDCIAVHILDLVRVTGRRCKQAYDVVDGRTAKKANDPGNGEASLPACRDFDGSCCGNESSCTSQFS